MKKEITPPAKAKNLFLDKRIIGCSGVLVMRRKQTQRSYNFSQLVQGLLVAELRKNGIPLPKEFSK